MSTTLSHLPRWGRFATGACLLALALGLSACGSSPSRPKPAELPPVVPLLATEQAWTLQLGEAAALLQPQVAGDRLVLANRAGQVSVVDAASGRAIWQAAAGSPLATGAGSDGRTVAVITRSNELVALRDGQTVWRVRLPASSFTPPLVAGERVFVLKGDRSVSAFDAGNGGRLWTQRARAEALVLGQAGVLLPQGNTLVVGLSGRMAGLDPLTGALRWEVPVAIARGANEVERLVDLVAPVSRVAETLCARAYSAAVGCVNAAQGRVVWTRPAQGVTGLAGDEQRLFGTETNGRVLAWDRASGEPLWQSERLLHRRLSAPLAVGRVVVVGDESGLVHVLSREDGSEMTRLNTDGSAVIGAPVLAGELLVVQTLRGGVYAWRPR
ncbi:MAG TPA: outer membrane protein assembly factor BamB [Hydrogenophaga sp.]|uniref:outer membrane protein assembly factor BamB n=1 Tax=Hydrogenophaga sp. TaxID=1904254 RepID=UPI002B6E4CF0|nr:outer membrane protein assembly factor BamB [Hydrogenophaga sp.]HMN91854.1 outer membrane protein assembly factor BamB [Hydrogenophaga sp.]HMP09006.1 outer membrane protein assembly factor BamB [Hydrogenophaga sp.]